MTIVDALARIREIDADTAALQDEVDATEVLIADLETERYRLRADIVSRSAVDEDEVNRITRRKDP